MSSGETKFKSVKTNSIIIDDLDIGSTGSFNIPSAGSYSFKEDGTVKMAIDAGILKVDTINELTATAGVTIDGVLVKDGGVTLAAATAFLTDIISEKTAATGVTIDGVLCKDGGVTLAAASAFLTDIISEVTATAGVTIDGALVKDGAVTLTAATALGTDIISEVTGAAGVTIDSVLCKDGGVTLTAATALGTDIISEVTGAAGVTIDSVLCKDGGVTLTAATALGTDIISEVTGAAGVTIDGVLCKDIGIACDKIEESTATNGIDIANYVNFSVGPLFIATLSADVDTLTGNGDAISPVLFNVELVDKIGHHANGVFTCPANASGTYQFDVTISMHDLAAAHEGTIAFLVTDGGSAVDAGTHIVWEGQCDDETGTAAGSMCVSGSKLVVLRPADTVTVVVDIAGGAKVVDIESDYSRFSGRLVSL